MRHNYAIITNGQGVIIMSKNVDGMRYPSVDQLLNVIDSKYKLAYAAARRARIIEEEDGYTSLENPVCVKSVGIALEEILEGKTIKFGN